MGFVKKAKSHYFHSPLKYLGFWENIKSQKNVSKRTVPADILKNIFFMPIKDLAV